MSRLVKLILVDLIMFVTFIVTAILADTLFRTILGMMLFLISFFGMIAFVLLTVYIVIEELIKKEG